MNAQYPIEAIASRFNAQRDAADMIANPQHSALVADTILTMAEEVADVFRRDNPRFDRRKFIEACGFFVDA